jgi:acyl dehydratase
MDRRLAASTDAVRFRVDATRCDRTPIPGLYADPGMTFGYLAGCAAAASVRPR